MRRLGLQFDLLDALAVRLDFSNRHDRQPDVFARLIEMALQFVNALAQQTYVPD
jgi:hypothetical protein